MTMQLAPSSIEIIAAVIFAAAVIHTFTTRYFERLARAQPEHAGLWHLLGEVEVVFGFWALVLMVLVAGTLGTSGAVTYLESRSFTEPAFVFVIMVIAGSRPILDVSGAALQYLGHLLPFPSAAGYYFVVLAVGPLLGSFITEPAAMTLGALLLRDQFFGRNAPKNFMYATLGVLFVNVSIGGTLTPFAAPPVVMVAEKWGWDIGAMMMLFGWKAAAAVIVNAAGTTFIFRSHLKDIPSLSPRQAKLDVPPWIIAAHLGFLVAVVIFSHHALVFIGLFLFFLGFSEAYKRYRGRLMLREGLLVAFFLAGLVTLGGWQKWWLEALLSDMPPSVLFVGATLLTAITDNAALTYLGSLVEGVSDEFKFSLVAGAVTGGGLTVIANAPNPAGFAILKGCFEDGAISPLGLLAAAAGPTLIAAAAFQLLPG
jgi:Putative Na+/H+ antiporter